MSVKRRNIYIILALIAAACLCLTVWFSVRPRNEANAISAVWNGTAATYFAGGVGTQEDPYQIANGEQLALLRALILGSGSVVVVEGSATVTYDYLRTAYYALTDSIVLNDTSTLADWATTAPSNVWTSIGNSDFLFNGKLDARGNSVVGI